MSEDLCRYCGCDHPGLAPRLPGGRYVSADTRQWIACREALGNEIIALRSMLSEFVSVGAHGETGDTEAAWYCKHLGPCSHCRGRKLLGMKPRPEKPSPG